MARARRRRPRARLGVLPIDPMDLTLGPPPRLRGEARVAWVADMRHVWHEHGHELLAAYPGGLEWAIETFGPPRDTDGGHR